MEFIQKYWLLYDIKENKQTNKQQQKTLINQLKSDLKQAYRYNHYSWVLRNPLNLIFVSFLNREVFKAKHRKNKKIVALKKVLMENEKEGVRF